jgi:hypothetical protein
MTLNASATTLTEAQKPSADAFKSMRYGLFTTVTYTLTITPDGQKSYASLDEFANGFDVNAYADAVQSMGVEYVFFTAWHFAMYSLGPNAALEKWLPGHTSKRDLIGEVADALNQRGIKLVIYAHPNDGHDLKPEEQEKIGYLKALKKGVPPIPKFNDFINEVYAELVGRYANKPNVIGFWLDSWHANGDRLDMPRLRNTILTAMPRAILLSNRYIPEFIDFYSLETYYTNGPAGDINNLIARNENQSTVFCGYWWCRSLKETSPYSAETLFKFTVLNACTGAPGGMSWAVSPAADGKTWTGNTLEVMQKLGAYIQPIRASLCGVAASPNWQVPDKSNFSASPGYGATRSLDGKKDYLHVLKAPQGKSLEVTLPKACDKCGAKPASFKSATLLKNGHPVKMEKTEQALRFTLAESDTWDPLDTVIVLELETGAQ